MTLTHSSSRSELDSASNPVLSLGPIIPTLTVHKLEDAIPLVSALKAGGIQAVEVTLRTPIALEVIETLKQRLPEMMVGVGTITTPEQLNQSVRAGAQFAFSPGSTVPLLEAGVACGIPFIPGVSSISECMQALPFGYQCFKFFPSVGLGEEVLKAWYGPFPQLRFCATGGLNASNFLKFLKLPNVICVGGAWMMPELALAEQDWKKVTQLCHESLELFKERDDVI